MSIQYVMTAIEVSCRYQAQDKISRIEKELEQKVSENTHSQQLGTPNFSSSPRKVEKVKENNGVKVKVTICGLDRDRTRELDVSLHSLGKALCRGKFKDICRAAYKNANVRKVILEEVLKDIKKEAIAMCSKKMLQY